MRTRTIIWLIVALSGTVAYVVALTESAPSFVRYVCAWYALVVLLGVFAVLGVTLSAKFGRLDTTEGLLARIFLLW